MLRGSCGRQCALGGWHGGGAHGPRSVQGTSARCTWTAAVASTRGFRCYSSRASELKVLLILQDRKRPSPHPSQARAKELAALESRGRCPVSFTSEPAPPPGPTQNGAVVPDRAGFGKTALRRTFSAPWKAEGGAGPQRTRVDAARRHRPATGVENMRILNTLEAEC